MNRGDIKRQLLDFTTKPSHSELNQLFPLVLQPSWRTGTVPPLPCSPTTFKIIRSLFADTLLVSLQRSLQCRMRTQLTFESNSINSASLIVGLVFIVVISILAYFFSPKGENQTYVFMLAVPNLVLVFPIPSAPSVYLMRWWYTNVTGHQDGRQLLVQSEGTHAIFERQTRAKRKIMLFYIIYNKTDQGIRWRLGGSTSILLTASTLQDAANMNSRSSVWRSSLILAFASCFIMWGTSSSYSSNPMLPPCLFLFRHLLSALKPSSLHLSPFCCVSETLAACQHMATLAFEDEYFVVCTDANNPCLQ